jgi:uncharacterized protein
MSFKGQELPVFPLELVLYPGAKLPLRLFEPRYLDMAKRCLNEDIPFVIVAIDKENGAPAKVGTTATIGEWDVAEQGIMLVKTYGGERVRVGNLSVGEKGLITAPVTSMPFADLEVPEDLQQSAEILKRFITQIGTERFIAPFNYDDAGWVSFRLAEILPIRLQVRQMLLELDDGVERLRVLQRVLIDNKLIEGRA